MVRPVNSAKVMPIRVMVPRTESPSMSTVTWPIFLGSPKVSRPPMTDCSVLMGMTRQ